MLWVDLLALGGIVVGLALGVTQVAAPLARGDELFPLFRRGRGAGKAGKGGVGRGPKTKRETMKKAKK